MKHHRINSDPSGETHFENLGEVPFTLADLCPASTALGHLTLCPGGPIRLHLPAAWMVWCLASGAKPPDPYLSEWSA